jgi:Lrp/AsnC family transcriptional regulator, leucine-responsive regulatory protein
MHTIDQTNLEILKILQEKARIPNVEVSRLINLAPSAVLERIRKMESQGIIDGYEVRLNPEQFNCTLISFVQVLPAAQADLPAIEAALGRLDQIQEVHRIAGDDCYLIKVRSADITALDRLLRESILTIAGVRSTRTLPVLATSKETARIPISS